jgi:hypothetical protein
MIEVRSRWYSAELTDGDDGVVVVIWQRCHASTVRKRVLRDVLPCPLHVARDKIHRLLEQLPNPAVIQGARR